MTAKPRGLKTFMLLMKSRSLTLVMCQCRSLKQRIAFPGSLGIDIETSEGQIVYTGDFKFDPSATPMYQTDWARLAQIGNKKVLALLSDSANAESPYPNANEHEIYDHIKETFEYQDGRIIVAGVPATFSAFNR